MCKSRVSFPKSYFIFRKSVGAFNGILCKNFVKKFSPVGKNYHRTNFV